MQNNLALTLSSNVVHGTLALKPGKRLLYGLTLLRKSLAFGCIHISARAMPYVLTSEQAVVGGHQIRLRRTTYIWSVHA